ncbi:MAG TPA: acyl-CoA synthetase, partial [Candidatus Acetothermia bacterium]|nr:acyl-CoA synthetase [Candidatus Acetothermia bacterium]
MSTPTPPQVSSAFPPFMTTSPARSESRSVSLSTSTRSPLRMTISSISPRRSLTLKRSSINPAAKAPRSIDSPSNSSATMAFVVPRVMTIVPFERAFLTAGSTATPLAITRFAAPGRRTTLAFIFLLYLPITLPICYKVHRGNSKNKSQVMKKMPYTKDEYEREMREFEWDIPSDYNIVDVVEAHAAKNPDKVAVFWEDASGNKRAVTFSELADKAHRFGAGLIKLGVKKADPVLHVLPRLPEALMAQLGTFVAGGVAVPCSEMLKPKEIAYRSVVSGGTVIVAHESTAPAVEEAAKDSPLSTLILIGGKRDGWISFDDLVAENPADGPKAPLSADDPMTINFTSGTTGNAKPVVHKHRWMYVHNRITGRYWWDASGYDVIWATTAPGWAKWYWSPIGVALTNGASQLMYNGRFDGERYLDLLERYKITKLCATPTEYRLFAQLPDMSKHNIVLKDALSAGEPLNVEPIEAFKRAFGVTIRDGYGQTESVCLVCNYP